MIRVQHRIKSLDVAGNGRVLGVFSGPFGATAVQAHAADLLRSEPQYHGAGRNWPGQPSRVSHIHTVSSEEPVAISTEEALTRLARP